VPVISKRSFPEQVEEENLTVVYLENSDLGKWQVERKVRAVVLPV